MNDLGYSEEELKAFQSRIRDHCLTGATSKCWRCKSPGNGTYGYWVTWHPRTVLLDGDVGSISITHACLSDWERGIRWLRSSNVEYLLEHSSERKDVFNVEESARFVTERALELDPEKNKNLYLAVWRELMDITAIRTPLVTVASNAKMRKKICAELVYMACDIEHDWFYEMAVRLGCHDWSGEYSWDPNAAWKMFCLQAAAKAIFNTLSESEMNDGISD